MNRRAFLGTLSAATAAALAGCGGDGDSTPQGTLIGGEDGDGGDGDGGDGGTTTEPPTTGAPDVFEGVDFDVEADGDGGTLTAWTIENVSDLTWSVTVVSVLEVEDEAGTETFEESERVTLGSGERTTVEMRHDVGFDEWSNFRFEFRDLERA